MNTMITRQDIEQDIVEYDRRILRLECKLQDTPGSSYKKIRKLKQEIKHVEGLRQLAVDALDDGPVNKLAVGVKDETI
jgi:hypothetical protein